MKIMVPNEKENHRGFSEKIVIHHNNLIEHIITEDNNNEIPSHKCINNFTIYELIFIYHTFSTSEENSIEIF